MVLPYAEVGEIFNRELFRLRVEKQKVIVTEIQRASAPERQNLITVVRTHFVPITGPNTFYQVMEPAALIASGR